MLVWRGELVETLRADWPRYLLVSFADVEANYCIVRAYQVSGEQKTKKKKKRRKVE
jgi:hypothetical protein